MRDSLKPSPRGTLDRWRRGLRYHAVRVADHSSLQDFITPDLDGIMVREARGLAIVCNSGRGASACRAGWPHLAVGQPRCCGTLAARWGQRALPRGPAGRASVLACTSPFPAPRLPPPPRCTAEPVPAVCNRRPWAAAARGRRLHSSFTRRRLLIVDRNMGIVPKRRRAAALQDARRPRPLWGRAMNPLPIGLFADCMPNPAAYFLGSVACLCSAHPPWLAADGRSPVVNARLPSVAGGASTGIGYLCSDDLGSAAADDVMSVVCANSSLADANSSVVGRNSSSA